MGNQPKLIVVALALTNQPTNQPNKQTNNQPIDQ
jgi:hypothetical protein